MSLQEQLAQPQRPSQHFQMFQLHPEGSLLGNASAQMPTRSASVQWYPEFWVAPVAELEVPVANAESDEMAWLVQNAHQLGQFKGEWLLIQARQLLVHSPDFAAVRTAIRERQIPAPFVYYVPTDDESNSITI